MVEIFAFHWQHFKILKGHVYRLLQNVNKLIEERKTVIEKGKCTSTPLDYDQNFRHTLTKLRVLLPL